MALHPFSALIRKPQRSELLGLEYTAKSRYSGITDHALTVMLYLLWGVIALVLVYTVRHYFFTLNRLFGEQRHPYLDIDTATWPSVSVLVAAHNEEAVIAEALQALLDVDYPADRLQIIPVNDRSTDRTQEIIDAIAAQHPGRLAPLHRRDGA
ncbi:MAG TPA: glycosyltransferase, partial [Methylophilaceae bacterium]|nr:glycosyltransferase [Methylophilaceae bacterium]